MGFEQHSKIQSFEDMAANEPEVTQESAETVVDETTVASEDTESPTTENPA